MAVSKIRRSFTERKPHTMKDTVTNYRFQKHAQERLSFRFKLTVEEVLNMSQYFKRADKQCRYEIIRRKLAKRPNQICFYNTKYNLMLFCDVDTKEVINCLFLDGRDGYNL